MKLPSFSPIYIMRFGIVTATLFTLGILTFTHALAQQESIKVVGKWITDKNGKFLLNPQTSGLSFYGDTLFSISDASADSQHIKKLHIIEQNTGHVDTSTEFGDIIIPQEIAQNSCFAEHLSARPDYEAVVALPYRQNQPQQWLLVTEDGSRNSKIKDECFIKYGNASNFTRYPALLVRISLLDKQLVVSGVRALRFEANAGTNKRDLIAFNPDKSEENDGIEGLALTKDGRLLFGLEQDAKRQARVFEIAYSDELFFKLDEFLMLQDSRLGLYEVSANNNPINGMDIYYPDSENVKEQNHGYLIAAARNRDQLWIIDLAKKQPIKVIDVAFYTPGERCEGKIHQMKRVAIEGVAIKGNTLYLVNDPWTQKYLENVGCSYDMEGYKANAALLFQLDMPKAWFN
jgi:hypothetical protein